MKEFERAIKAYLDDRAANDPLFAQSYAKPNKSIGECCKFIMGEVYSMAVKVKGGKAAGTTDAEIFGMAVHYYDEDDIKIKPISGTCNVIHTGPNVDYEPTEEDKEEARKAALKRLEDEAYEKLHAPKKKKAVEASTEQTAGTGTQTSLFDLMQ